MDKAQFKPSLRDKSFVNILLNDNESVLWIDNLKFLQRKFKIG